MGARAPPPLGDHEFQSNSVPDFKLIFLKIVPKMHPDNNFHTEKSKKFSVEGV